MSWGKRKMPRKKEPLSLVCPRCGNTLIEQCGLYYQCVSSDGNGHYEGNRFVQDHEGCGYVGTVEEFTLQKELR